MATTTIQTESHSLSDLALQISSLAYTVSTLLKAAGSAPLTTTSDSTEASEARASLPADVRNQLAEAALDLWSVAIGPEERVRRLAIDWNIPSALRYIVHFGIPDLVPQTGEISYNELAGAAKVPEAHLKRILRLANTAGIFKESSPGHVAHTILSVRLSSAYPELSNYVAHCLEFSSLVAARMPEMSERWSGSEAKTHTAFNVAYNTEEPLFQWLQHEPAHAVRFGKLMGAMRKNPSWDVKHLVEGWEGWGQFEEGAKVVDVGGSIGHASVALAEKYEGLKFVVQDLGYVVAQAKESKSVPEALGGRVELMAHDFFTEQPVNDADVYLLRQILHDWADDAAVKILKGIVPALQKEGSRILIMDQVVPPPGTLQRSQEREARTVDLVVMSHFNGKQRDLEEWERVLQTADKRLKISKVVQPVGSHFAIIEVVLTQPTKVIENGVTAPVVVEKEEELASYGGDPLVVDSDSALENTTGQGEEVTQPKENGVHPVSETVAIAETNGHQVQSGVSIESETVIATPASAQKGDHSSQDAAVTVDPQVPATEKVIALPEESIPAPTTTNGTLEKLAIAPEIAKDSHKGVNGTSETKRTAVVA
jgi:6-hydroxytryprostatin B O-methyltransferase